MREFLRWSAQRRLQSQPEAACRVGYLLARVGIVKLCHAGIVVAALAVILHVAIALVLVREYLLLGCGTLSIQNEKQHESPDNRLTIFSN